MQALGLLVVVLGLAYTAMRPYLREMWTEYRIERAHRRRHACSNCGWGTTARGRFCMPDNWNSKRHYGIQKWGDE